MYLHMYMHSVDILKWEQEKQQQGNHPHSSSLATSKQWAPVHLDQGEAKEERSASICTSVLSAGILIPYQGAKPAMQEAAQLDHLPPRHPQLKCQ